MGLTDNLFPVWLLIVTAVLFVGILVRAIRQTDWQWLRSEQRLHHCLFGAAVVLGFLWQLRAGLSPGLSIHIFGMTAVTLMLGWRLAVFSGLLALVIVVITGREPATLFAVNGLITVMVPALVTHAIMCWERRRNFRNFFAYIFFCGFFGAGASVLAAGMTMVILLWLTGVYDWYHLQHDYVRYLPLFVLPEGFVNGAVVTGLMVFHPELLSTLDERRYR
ncbi:energy-coupling factor ABC transporter permease [Marinobacter bryozoorum]|uniref:energy-coupling factor ABC transporter permease n=1 Tax=Marinobacter bryozoorum TaxID=256324 RepID=UPI002005CBCB|nr:energy-coupling factor ABC transporter permease [Marinobacter bryozoorum]MCK7542616.1 energy-coupling factor ABC transporter permease [Marinobacter bryozoorum]